MVFIFLVPYFSIMTVNTAHLAIKDFQFEQYAFNLGLVVELKVILLFLLQSNWYLIMLISTNQTSLKSESLGIPSVQLRKDELIIYYSNKKLIE